MSMRATAILAAVLVLALLPGCKATSPTGKAEGQGFLGDYSMLKPGGEGQAQLVYVDPATDFSVYKRVMLDPIMFWFSPESDLKDVPKEDREALARYLHDALRKRLQADYAFVDEPGPDVMRVRFAITEAVGSKALGDAVTVVGPGRIISAGKKLVTGTHAFVGKAAIEAEVVDSTTGKRLAAAVDERAGGKRVQGVTSTWGDVQAAFDYWAAKFAKRLSDFRLGRR